MATIAIDDKKFGVMTVVEKIVFVGKLIVFLGTFGFAYPNLVTDSRYNEGPVKIDPTI